MIVISEYELTEEQRQKYKAKGYRVAYGNQNPRIFPGESVGILLDKMFKSTMELIDNLLFRHHTLTLKYEDKTYTLNSLEDWKESYQSDKDSLKTTSVYHPIYTIYLQKRDERFNKIEAEKNEEQYDVIYNNFGTELPEDIEIDNFLNAFARLYEVDIDYKDRISKIMTYYQIKWYLDNDIPYANEPSGISVYDEGLFNPEMFKINYEPEITVESFGDETYFEDYCYKSK